MTRVVTRRVLTRIALGIAGGVAVLWAAATAVFVMMRVLPGDPAAAILGPNAPVGEDVRERLRSELGLDRPVLAQYLDYLGGLLRGDLGRSYQLRKDVTDVIASQVGPTVQLAVAALTIAVVLVLVGALLGRRAGLFRSVVATTEQLVAATPVFWVGLVLLTVFAFGLRWFPVSGGTGAALILPAATLALPVAAVLGQVFRDGVEAAEAKPFAETVRSRGAGPTRILVAHTARHGLVATVPMAAYLLGSLFGGAIVVETVFARPGIGRVTLAAILQRDFPLIAGLLLLSTAAFIVVSILSDALVALIDPRLRGAEVHR